tara:strand:- start:4170 stop:4535 length:366 start_codon:yes stop_codon:yes gene_type:complete
MILGIFKNISNKLIYLDKLKIPLENIDIVKSFAFHEINSLSYYKVISQKKKTYIDKFTKIKYLSGTSNGHWAFGFVSNNNPLKYSQIHGRNCIKCGEYQLTFWKSYQKYHSGVLHVPHCRC